MYCSRFTQSEMVTGSVEGPVVVLASAAVVEVPPAAVDEVPPAVVDVSSLVPLPHATRAIISATRAANQGRLPLRAMEPYLGSSFRSKSITSRIRCARQAQSAG
jgi:hypothetical protein